ncbi:MAG TPA: M20 family peptidase [Bacteroidia bacterium]|jgi:carboxypeptidase PM20D1|nr:M20 family peptidase [Bacteroidia bacterium]
MLLKLLKFLGLALLCLIAVLLVRMMLYPSRQIHVPPVIPREIGDDGIARLAGAVQFRTVSYDDSAQADTAAFAHLIHYLIQTYPLTTANLHPEKVSGSSLLYCWKGSDAGLQPMLLIGHMDVVPAADEEKWEHPPFGGEVAQGYIWGRGTLDDKVNVVSILEAVESLLKQGYKPKRTIYLGFGQDEEVGGKYGALRIVDVLKLRKVKAGFLLDEGLMIARGLVPGISKDVALIGIAEKGYMSLELTVDAEAGHSSLPPKETAIGILATAVSRLENNPMPADFCEPVNEFLDHIGPEMPFFNKLVFANRWLFKPLIIHKYESTSAGRSVVRTTTAATEFHSGVKENVIPGHARALVNFRILPGQTSEEVISRVSRIISDERIHLKRVGHGNEPSAVSDYRSEGYATIQKTIAQTFPEALISPSLVVAATDARHYAPVADNLYRFIPITVKAEDLSRIHGLNERIAIADFKNCIRFFEQLIRNANP